MPAVASKNRVIVPNQMRGVPAIAFAVSSGDLAAVAAETASAGHIGSLINTGDVEFLITWMRIWYQVNVQPSTQQGFGFAVKKTSATTIVQATGGTGAAAFTPRSRAEGSVYTVPSGITGRMAGSDALTAGTYTIGAKILELFGFELVAGAANVKRHDSVELWGSDRHPIAIVGKNEGLLLANQVLEANSLAVKVGWEAFGYARDVAA